MGFCEFQVREKLVRRQGAAWTFRAKRDDELEVVIGAYEDEAERAVEVQAMLESKSVGLPRKLPRWPRSAGSSISMFPRIPGLCRVRRPLPKHTMTLVKNGKCLIFGTSLTWTSMSRWMASRT